MGNKNNKVFLYGIGTTLIAVILSSLIFGWAQDTMAAAQTSTDIAAPAEITTAKADRSVRVILASPYRH